MRYRELDNRNSSYSANIQTIATNGTQTNGTVMLTDYCPQFWVGSMQTMEDVVIKDYARRSAEGEIFNNPMTKTVETRSWSGGQFGYFIPKSAGQTANYSQSWGGGTAVLSTTEQQCSHAATPVDIRRLREIAGTQARANVASPSFGGATAIAELNETLYFLNNPIKGWREFAVRMKRLKAVQARKYSPGDIRRKKLQAKTVAEFISDNWLRYRYGVRPLVHDIESLVKTLQKPTAAAEPRRFTARGYATDNHVSNDTWEVDYGTPVLEFARSTNHTVKVRTGILYDWVVVNDFGLSIPDVPSAIWEATRFSFVVDWFANIGTFLEAITPRVGVRYLSSWTTVIDEKETDCTTRFTAMADYAVNKPRTITADGTVVEYFKTTVKSRRPGVTLGINWMPLPYSGARGVKRIVDSVALTHKILRSR